MNLCLAHRRHYSPEHRQINPKILKGHNVNDFAKALHFKALVLIFQVSKVFTYPKSLTSFFPKKTWNMNQALPDLSWVHCFHPSISCNKLLNRLSSISKGKPMTLPDSIKLVSQNLSLSVQTSFLAILVWGFSFTQVTFERLNCTYLLIFLKQSFISRQCQWSWEFFFV